MPFESATLSGFFAAWELFETAALTGTVAGALLGMLGVYVVLRRMVFLTAAVSQAAGLGVALVFLAELHLGFEAFPAAPTLGAGALTLLTVLPFALSRDLPAGRQDSLLGFAYLIGAAGTLAAGTRIVHEIQDIETLLFGTAVAVLPEDFSLVLWVAVTLALLHAWWWRGFAAASFDRAGAVVRGMPVGLLELALFSSLAIAISVATRVIGALPTFAFSVLPAMAAVRLAPNVPASLCAAAIIGAASGFLGYLAAYLYDLPVGAAQTLVAALFAAAAAVGRLVR